MPNVTIKGAVKHFVPKKICVMASGGDAPGMNACMEACFNYATHLGWQAYVAIMGYDGLVKDNIVLATRDKCNNISHIAGCVYRCGRSESFATPQGFQAAIDTIKRYGFDAVIVIGGNGSFLGLERLKRVGINVIGIPATIDNDVYFTKNSLGFSSACEAITHHIDLIKTTMQTNERDHLVQVMGRDCSDIALTVGVATFANIIDIIERRHTSEEIARIFTEQQELGNLSCLAVVQEKRPDAETLLKDIQVASNNTRVRMDVLGYFQRGASPSCRDRYLGASYGVMAVDLVAAKKFGVGIGLINDDFRIVDLEIANKARPRFNVENYNLINKIANH